MKNWPYFISTIIILLCFNVVLKAQQNDFKLGEAPVSAGSFQPIQLKFTFPRLHQTAFYFNKSQKEKVLKLFREGKTVELLPALEQYINQFGPENFARDYELLWMLAQLYERLDRRKEAITLYKLILQHMEFDVRYVIQYFDSIQTYERDSFVPIRFYYDLVEFRKQVDSLIPPQSVLTDMGSSINSPYDDYGPSLNFNRDLLIFASKRNVLRQGSTSTLNEDIYWSEKQEDGGWGQATALTSINTRFNEGAPCLSRDGETLYFARCESPDVMGSCDLLVSQKKPNGEWGDAVNLGKQVNSAYWDSHPALSHNEDTLFFVSDRPGGFGSNDIYFSVKKKGQWQKAQNLGPYINTRGSDVSPFYHPKYHVLYFSSTGHILNFGKFDIYRSHLIHGQWTEPKNIGPLVNGKGDEYFFAIDSDSENLFYARSEEKNLKNLDLFSFPLPMEAQPTATTIFRGTLTDSVTGQPFKGIVSVIDVDKGIEVAPKYLRPDGSFEFDLINNNRYLLIMQGEDFFRVEELINLTRDTVLNFKTPSVNFVKLQFSSIEFASNSWEILPEMEEDLNKMLRFLVDNPALHLKISGHTDSRGIPEVNQRLSERRANAIRSYLLNKAPNLDPSRIDAMGYGSSMPLIKVERSDQDAKTNRRVEFDIIRTD